VRYWCRRQRDGGSPETVYPARSLLSSFDPLVPFVILRLRLEHPKWGPGVIRFHLGQRASLAGLALPSPAQIGRYLHQWSRFRRSLKQKAATPPAGGATRVHQRWKLDFKVKIQLTDTPAQLFSLTDEFSGACVGSYLFAHAGTSPQLEHVKAFLRARFARMGLPEEIQTDGEVVLVGRAGQHYFPSRFTLWLAGFGIAHRVIAAGKPTQNAEVERTHRTFHEYALVTRHPMSLEQANACLEKALQRWLHEIPSQGKKCRGRPRSVAYPALLDPHRAYHPTLEPRLFCLEKVDAFLAHKTWVRQVEKNGQIVIGEQRGPLVCRSAGAGPL
jgi:transposase InsO family protein